MIKVVLKDSVLRGVIEVDADRAVHCIESGFIELLKDGNLKASFNANEVVYYMEIPDNDN